MLKYNVNIFIISALVLLLLLKTSRSPFNQGSFTNLAATILNRNNVCFVLAYPMKYGLK
jgi:hypothetical protein